MTGRWPDWSRMHPVLAHVLGALVVAVAVAEHVLSEPVSAGSLLGVLGLTLPVLWCRRAPIAAVLVTFGTLAVREGFDGDVTSEGYVPVIALLWVSYQAGRRTAGRRSQLAAALLLGLTWTSVAFGPDPDLGAMLLSFLITTFPALGPWLAGTAIRDRDDRVRQLVALTEELRQERSDRLRLSLEIERAHLARELHDVLAHSVTVMVVQAEAAEELIARRPDQAAESLRRIQESGRAALTETRQVLYDLRAERMHHLDEIHDLVAEAGAGGLSVELHTVGQPRPLAMTAQTSVYRIVQESLTNVRKHSDARRVRVILTWSETGLEVSVTDDGTASWPEEGVADRGLGLRGMRERAELHGGELRAGRGPAEGFTVTARIPLEVRVP